MFAAPDNRPIPYDHHCRPRLQQGGRGEDGLGISADGTVEHDRQIVELLARLNERGLEDNTIVMESTDNGAEAFTWPDGVTTLFRDLPQFGSPAIRESPQSSEQWDQGGWTRGVCPLRRHLPRDPMFQGQGVAVSGGGDSTGPRHFLNRRRRPSMDEMGVAETGTIGGEDAAV